MPATLLARNRNFRLLFSASAVSNLGDGVSALAFPWLATLLTRDPVLIGAVAAAGRLPWFLFSIPAGVITDRVDRKRLMVRADVFRMLLTMGVIALIFSVPTLPMGENGAFPYLAALAGLAFLLGSAEVLRDNAAQTALPSIVASEDLETANGQIWSVENVMGRFVGPPLAGLLIALAVPAPFALDALTFALAAWLVWMIAAPVALEVPARRSFVAELLDGARWLWGNALILRLAILLGLVNAVSMAYLTLIVLYAQEILGLTAAGLGLLMTAGAAGAVLGGLLGPAIARRIGPDRALRLALLAFLAEPLAIALTSSVVLVGAGQFVAMFAAVTYNVVTVSFRQRSIPGALLGRVNSLYRFFGWGVMPLGALGGGLLVAVFEPALGREAALRAPYLLGAAAMLGFYLFARIAIRFPEKKTGHKGPVSPTGR